MRHCNKYTGALLQQQCTDELKRNLIETSIEIRNIRIRIDALVETARRMGPCQE